MFQGITYMIFLIDLKSNLIFNSVIIEISN